MNGYVYQIKNIINNRKYIGVSMKCDEKSVKNYYGSGLAIKNAIKKYGKENFKKEILKEFESECEAREYEKTLIEEVDAVNSFEYYNLSGGGYGGAAKGRVITEETKRKISKANKGHKGAIHSEEHIKYMSDLMKGRISPMKGKKQNKESKKKISEAAKKKKKKRKELGIKFSGWKQEIAKCPHCEKTGGSGLMKRWHFDNCKQKINKK